MRRGRPPPGSHNPRFLGSTPSAATIIRGVFFTVVVVLTMCCAHSPPKKGFMKKGAPYAVVYRLVYDDCPFGHPRPYYTSVSTLPEEMPESGFGVERGERCTILGKYTVDGAFDEMAFLGSLTMKYSAACKGRDSVECTVAYSMEGVRID